MSGALALSRQMGLGIGGGSSGGGTPAPAPISYTLLHDFESLTGVTASQSTASLHTGSRKLLGSAGIRVVSNGGASATSGGLTNAGSTVAYNFASAARIAFRVDLGDKEEQNLQGLIPEFTTGGITYSYFPQDGSRQFTGSRSARGVEWMARSVADLRQTNASGTRLDSLGTITPIFRTNPVAHWTGGAADVDYVVDALVALDASYKPNLILGFDDSVGTQSEIALAAMDAQGLKATFYVLADKIGVAGNQTWGQLAAAKDNGHALCLNSGPNDEPATYFASPAAWLASLEAAKAKIQLNIPGRDFTDDFKHIASSYHRTGLDPDITAVITCSGTDTITYASAWANLTVGQRIFGTGVPAGCYITELPTNGSFKTSSIIPSGSRSLTFGGWKRGIAISSGQGTDTITVAAGVTDSLYANMAITSGVGCAGLRIVSLTSTTIQFEGIVPVGTTAISIGDVDHPWWNTKVQDALIAAGYLSLRRGGTYTGLFNGFGRPEPKRWMQWPAVAPTASVSTTLTLIDEILSEGGDCELYWHTTLDSTYWADLCAALRTRIDAGLCVNETKPVNLAKVLLRVEPS